MRDVTESVLFGKARALRPTFGALVRIEKKLGRSVLRLVFDPADPAHPADLLLSDVAAVVQAALGAVGEEKTDEEVGAELLRVGLPAAFGFVRDYLLAALSPGPEAPADSAGGAKSG